MLVALAGFGGAVVGALATVLASLASEWNRRRMESAREEPMRRVLLAMLRSGYNWRSLDTLRHVIGADETVAKRLLLEIGARASEDGKDLWGLISRNPLP